MTVVVLAKRIYFHHLSRNKQSTFFTMTAYVISRKDFKYRNALSFFFYFTTLFNGGMVCSYIFYIQYLHLKDSYLALIFTPGVFNVFYLLIT